MGRVDKENTRPMRGGRKWGIACRKGARRERRVAEGM